MNSQVFFKFGITNWTVANRMHSGHMRHLRLEAALSSKMWFSELLRAARNTADCMYVVLQRYFYEELNVGTCNHDFLEFQSSRELAMVSRRWWGGQNSLNAQNESVKSIVNPNELH